MKTMRAVVATEPGGPEVLRVVERPIPEPGPGEVLIRVAAAGVNRPDLMQRSGAYAPPPGVTDVLGLEVAGTVEAIGAGVVFPGVGERVMALVGGGGYAEFCLAVADHCLPVPPGLSWMSAAALPEATFTVWHNLFELGGLRPGETALLQGGASGIGTTAIQLARATGASAIACVGSAEKADAVAALGARPVNRKNEDFVAVALAATSGRGVDVVLDIVGGDNIARNLEALAPGGRHVSIAFLQGAKVSIDMTIVMRKQISLTASTLRPKSREEKARLARAVARHVMPIVAAGGMAPVMWATLHLDAAADAHRILEANENIGKVVLSTGTA